MVLVLAMFVWFVDFACWIGMFVSLFKVLVCFLVCLVVDD